MKNKELEPCPSGLDTTHKPYLVYWDDKHETLICPTALVQCTCGFKGPERYGDDCQERAIESWNTRRHPEQGLVALDEESFVGMIADVEWEGKLYSGKLTKLSSKAIVSKFGQQRIVYPDKLSENNLCQGAEENYVGGYNQAIDDMKKLNGME